LDQWKTTLAYALLHQKPKGPLPDFLGGVELLAKISGESTATITIRRNVGGITQNLGSLDLEQDDEREEVDVFKWVDVAAATTDDLRVQLDQSLASSSSQQDQIAKLTAELEQLVKAKREHENELLSKFAALLNAKKLKIRDQQRLLSRASVNSDALEDVRGVRRSSPKVARKAGASRGAKRKSKASSVQESEDEDDDATDGGDSERKQQETPSNSGEEATEGEDDEDSGFAPAPPPSQSSGRALRSQTTGKASQAEASDAMEVDNDEIIPPRRELPFGSKKSETRKQSTPPPSNSTAAEPQVDEDEETDDEL
jgi:hypothetical protein